MNHSASFPRILSISPCTFAAKSAYEPSDRINDGPPSNRHSLLPRSREVTLSPLHHLPSLSLVDNSPIQNSLDGKSVHGGAASHRAARHRAAMQEMNHLHRCA